MALRTQSSIEKAAAVVIALGAENASKVYKYLHEDEIEMLSLEISKMSTLPADDMKEIIEDFYGLCVTQKVMTEGGVEYARDVLEKAFGQQQALSLMERVSKSLRTKAFNFIRKADYKSLMNIIQNEHPQTIALLLSYARADQASMIISELSKDRRIDVVERIAKLDRASPEIINLVERELEKKFAAIVSVDLMEIGGLNYVADIMNHVDRGTEKNIFDELNNKDPQLAEDVRKLMFVFEDITFLDSMSIQRFIREIDTKDLAVALKAANPDVSAVIFQNMSKRMQESIRTDMEYLHNVRLRDVEDAQQKIVSIIRKLEEEGELVISKGGKDDIIV
ncbi:flagellar motor switch protein FliG [Hydrogenoanaerobacterium sp.]|uniref:flagellar motor switch protein FliG n=1 Tax=Hydrogenoanaerobacterium sp. TaxID=2953763 RepID=UPI0037C1504D